MMKVNPLRILTLPFVGAFVALNVTAQDFDEINFVRENVAYKVTDEFGPNPNNIEVFPDYCIDFQEDPEAQGSCGKTSPYGISFEEFLQLLETAYAEGRGGVIDFENPIIGPILQAPDRTGYRAVVEQWQLDTSIEQYEEEVRAEMPELGDRATLNEAFKLQIEDGLARAREMFPDPETVPVFARADRGVDDEIDQPFGSKLWADELIALYGTEFETQLRITRGPKMFDEGELATDFAPGPVATSSWINGDSFPDFGIATYSGGNYTPISGINSMNSGMVDLEFDPRDNVKAVGFAFLTFGNFQYWQGSGGLPNNPNNMRVTAFFSDGTSEELAETSRQSGGNHDVFFGIRAPEGESITRIWCRSIGNNWRTFVSIDDLTFITAPAPPFLSSRNSYTGTADQKFFAAVKFGKQPESIEFTNLPEGISFNEKLQILEGTFAESGTFVTEVILENEVGSISEEITFEVNSALPDQLEEGIGLRSLDGIRILLRRPMDELEILTSYDDLVSVGEKIFFSKVEKQLDQGGTQVVDLDDIGLGLSAGQVRSSPFPEDIGQIEQIDTDEDSGTFITVSGFGRRPVEGYQANIVPYTVQIDPETGEPKEDIPENRNLLPLIVDDVEVLSAEDNQYEARLFFPRIFLDQKEPEVKFILPNGEIVTDATDLLGLQFSLFRVGIGTLTGTPSRGEAVGTYDVTVFVRTPYSADKETLQVVVLPPVVSPNLNSDKTTDYLVRSNESLHAMVNDPDNTNIKDFQTNIVLDDIAKEETLHLGDFNGDNRTDILGWNPTDGYVRQYLTDVPGEPMTPTTLLENMGTGFNEELLGTGDFNGDLSTDLFWVNRNNQSMSIWLMKEGKILWAGMGQLDADFSDFLFSADLSGGGRAAIIGKLENSGYYFEEFTLFNNLGKFTSDKITFSMEERFQLLDVLDINNDGRQDLLWEDTEGGALYYWPVDGLEALTSYFEKEVIEIEGDEETVPVQDKDGRLVGLPGERLLRGGLDWGFVAAVDLSGDKFPDLVLKNKQSGSFGIQQMRTTTPIGVIENIGLANYEVVFVGDFNADEAQDLLLQNRSTGELAIITKDSEGNFLSSEFGSFEADGKWLNGYNKRNEVPALPTAFPYLGRVSFLNPDIFSADGFGTLWILADGGDSGSWFYDFKLGSIWTSDAFFPLVFSGETNFWLAYIRGTRNPRIFFNHVLGFYVSEDDLAFPIF